MSLTFNVESEFLAGIRRRKKKKLIENYITIDCSSILFSQDMSEFSCFCPWNLVIDNFVLGFEKKKFVGKIVKF
jgi:serine kinase of HPr protein (carbohydrate metabolism regulator)